MLLLLSNSFSSNHRQAQPLIVMMLSIGAIFRAVWMVFYCASFAILFSALRADATSAGKVHAVLVPIVGVPSPKSVLASAEPLYLFEQSHIHSRVCFNRSIIPPANRITFPTEGNLMLPIQCVANRRNFLKGGVGMAVGLSALAALHVSVVAAENSWIVGPQPGFTPEIGTLTSMLAFTRRQVLNNVKGLSQQDLDFLLDANANTIGALLLHLVATETYYQMNTFDGMKWDSWPEKVKKTWDIPMNLGEPARKAIKGNSLDYYLDGLHQAREKSLAEFRKRDDKWLATLVTEGNFSANNYAKWFHVAEHESNHDGQIKFLKKRIPGAKTESE
jgi:uncharacterized damage-inducible protein DinB